MEGLHESEEHLVYHHKDMTEACVALLKGHKQQQQSVSFQYQWCCSLLTFHLGDVDAIECNMHDWRTLPLTISLNFPFARLYA